VVVALFRRIPVSILAEFREGVAYPIHYGPDYVGFVHIVSFHFPVLPPIILKNVAFR
jgi:hypothetical protein